jgi:hypothetical protein
MKDNVKARIINEVQDNVYVKSDSTEKIRSQIELYKYYRNILQKADSQINA